MADVPPEIQAIHDVCTGLGHYVCPLFARRRGNGYLVGTGIPMRFGAVAIIATASHVLGQFEGEPLYTYGLERVLGLGGERRGFGHKAGETVDVDLAVVVLNELEAAELGRRYTFTADADLAEPRPSTEVAFYTLVGYPFSKNKPTPKSRYHMNAQPLFFLSRTLVDLRQDLMRGKDPAVHFGISAPRHGAMDILRRRVTLPKPQGVSGGGVWYLDYERADDPLPRPRLVGIGIEYDQGAGRFVCTRVQNVKMMVEDLLV